MILASSSPQRRDLIKYISYDIKCMSVDIEEKFIKNLNIYENTKEIAISKAGSVIDKYNITNDIIIGVDTIVSVEGKILLKPKDYKEAFDMIKLYEHKRAEIISGVAIIKVVNGEKNIKTFTESSFVKFNNITDEKIKEWLLQDDYLGCSGAIKIEKVKDIFNADIEGSVSNIIGLPLEKLSKELFYIDDNRFKVLYSDDVDNKFARVRSACRVLPMKDDKVFVVKQKNRSNEIGYTLIGGGCTIDEDLIEGGKREALEEAGFIMDNLKPIGLAKIYNEDKNLNKYGFKDAIFYHYICCGDIVEYTNHERLEYEVEMIDDIVGMDIDEAIKVFKEQNKDFKDADNDFFYKFNLGVVESLEELKNYYIK